MYKYHNLHKNPTRSAQIIRFFGLMLVEHILRNHHIYVFPLARRQYNMCLLFYYAHSHNSRLVIQFPSSFVCPPPPRCIHIVCKRNIPRRTYIETHVNKSLRPINSRVVYRFCFTVHFRSAPHNKLWYDVFIRNGKSFVPQWLFTFIYSRDVPFVHKSIVG